MTMTPDQPISWGILGTGTIARQFTEQLVTLSDARLVGAASRNPDQATGFAQSFTTHGTTPKAFDSYAALCADSAIDIVYIATPTATHAELARMALNAGKAILCEKPFCRTAQEAEEIFALARTRGLFAMEAMWMRFNPMIQKTKSMIEAGEIGDLCTVTASLGYAKDADRLGTREEGRGARLAFGCYGVSLALYLLGRPKQSTVQVVRTPEGGEQTASVALQYPQTSFVFQCSEWATLRNTVHLQGRQGAITIGDPFINATSLQIYSPKRLAKRSAVERLKDRASRLGLPVRHTADHYYPEHHHAGFQGEAMEAMRCLRAGLLESPAMPHTDTLHVHYLLTEA